MAGDDQTANGSRFVTHQRLAEVMDHHRTVEVPALTSRVEARIERRATIDRVARIEVDVRDLERVTADHEALLHQMRGMASLARIALGTSIIGAVVSLLAIIGAVR